MRLLSVGEDVAEVKLLGPVHKNVAPGKADPEKLIEPPSHTEKLEADTVAPGKGFTETVSSFEVLVILPIVHVVTSTK